MIRALIIALLLLSSRAFAGDFSVTYPQTAYVYATSSGILRRVIMPGPGETSHQQTGAGETAVVQPGGTPIDEASINTDIKAKIGKDPQNNLCGVVDATNVVAKVIKCDPALDTVAGATLIQNPEVATGDTWTGGTTFTRPFAVIDPITGNVDDVVSLTIDNPVSPIAGDVLVINKDGSKVKGTKVKIKKPKP